MELIIRAAAVYFSLLIIFRLAGRRTLADTTTFDLILLLVISEAVQQALFGKNDPSYTSALVVVLTLVGLDVALSVVKFRHTRIAMWLDGVPMILIDRGRVLEDRLRRSRVDIEDILAVARQEGYFSVKEIEIAVLEANGRISIIPRQSGKSA